MRTIDWVRTVVLATLLALWSFRRLLWSDFQFVGNDSDLTYTWIPRMRFSRTWLHAGEPAFWNPFSGLGRPLELGAEHPFSLIGFLQRFWPQYDKGLDYLLLTLLVIAAASASTFLLQLGFAPFVAVLGALLWVCCGMTLTQLFAGHVAIYAAFCLAPLCLALTAWSLRRASLVAAVPAALGFAAVLSCGSLQAAHIVLCMMVWFFLLRALMGSPDPVAPLALRWSGRAPRREGLLLSKVEGKLRLREGVFTAVRLLFIALLGCHLSHYVWAPLVASGELITVPESPFLHSAPPMAWLSLLLPQFFLGAGEEYNWVGWASWEGQVGLSSATALLVGLGLTQGLRRDLLLPLAFGVPLALIACGDAFGVYALYARIDPVVAYFEVPSRFTYGVNIALCLLACWGLQILNNNGWELSSFARTWSVRLLGAIGLFWVLLYYSDGMNPLWLAFQHRLQFGYRFATQLQQGPAEYYVLFWTRFTAALALNGALLYCLVRLRGAIRPVLVVLLLLLDVTRVPHAYLNLRSNQDFLPASGLSDVFGKSSAPGKVVNRIQPLWTGSLGMLRFFEISEVLDSAGLEVELLEAAKRFAPALATLDTPNALTRLLGVEFYLHPKSLMQDQKWLATCAGLTNFAAPDGDWSITRDNQQRQVVYVSRDFRAVADWKQLHSVLSQPTFRPRDNSCFLQPPISSQILASVRGKGYDRLAPLSVSRPESLELTEVLPNSVVVRCFLKSPGLVVLNQAWSPYWRVSVDLQSEPCFPCHLGLNRGVLVGPGEHEIRFTYEPEHLTSTMHACWIRLVVVLLVCLGVLGLDRLRKWAMET